MNAADERLLIVQAAQKEHLLPERRDRLVGERLMGTALHYLGEQASARSYLENVLKNYAAPLTQEHIRRFHFDQRVLARAILARVPITAPAPSPKITHVARSV